MNETLNFRVGDNSYTIKYPSVGDYYAIQASKQSLSLGFYNDLARSTIISGQNAADMVDVEATLTVLCPKLVKDLKCDSFKQLGLKDYLMVKEAYMEQFLPWWNEIENLLNPRKEETKDSE